MDVTLSISDTDRQRLHKHAGTHLQNGEADWKLFLQNCSAWDSDRLSGFLIW